MFIGGFQKLWYIPGPLEDRARGRKVKAKTEL